MLKLLTGTVRRTRQHHGLEHATITGLAARFPGRRISGLSDLYGFTIFGNLEQAQVQRAVSDALLRLQAGEARLAIHPNCGTNLAVKSLLAAIAAMLAQVGTRNPLDQLARTILFIMPALVLGEPLGYRAQRYTTSADLANRWVVGVRIFKLGPVTINRVVME